MSLFNKILEATIVHTTAGAASRVLERGIEQGTAKIKGYWRGRQQVKDDTAAEEALEVSTAATEMRKEPKSL